jgi:hypothetical protein
MPFPFFFAIRLLRYLFRSAVFPFSNSILLPSGGATGLRGTVSDSHAATELPFREFSYHRGTATKLLDGHSQLGPKKIVNALYN